MRIPSATTAPRPPMAHSDPYRMAVTPQANGLPINAVSVEAFRPGRRPAGSSRYFDESNAKYPGNEFAAPCVDRVTGRPSFPSPCSAGYLGRSRLSRLRPCFFSGPSPCGRAGGNHWRDRGFFRHSSNNKGRLR
jgi:hypothetical protein